MPYAYQHKMGAVFGSHTLNILLALLFLVLLPKSNANLDPVYMCSGDARSQIFCQGGNGSILHTVLADHKLYAPPNDTKSFVDSALKFDPVLANFQKVNKSSRQEIEDFLNANFHPPGSELVNCTPDDWNISPKAFSSIVDPHYRQWAHQINDIWKELCKEMKPSVKENIARHSLLELPYPFIAPGDRFREPYYWDTYWIIRGLLVSEMYETSRKMILNLASLCEKYGFVPNGGRIYYLKRSQPPFLTLMVYDYIMATGQMDFLDEKVGSSSLIEVLMKEFSYWNQYSKRSVTIKGETFDVFQYTTDSNTPRPESYDKDILTAQFTAEDEKPKLFQNIASTAASGWDFGCKWLRDCDLLNSSKIDKIVPVELNSYICQNARILSFFLQKKGDTGKADSYLKAYKTMVRTVRTVFWNDTDGIWYDYHTDQNGHNTKTFLTSVTPLFTMCYDRLDARRVDRAYSYLKNSGALSYPDGVPVSLRESGQQWDFPFAWPPMIHMLVSGLRMSRSAEAQEFAYDIAKRWVAGNYLTFVHTGFMYEKYNVTTTDYAGEGGEYATQKGFGWSNGVILDFLHTYGARLRSPPVSSAEDVGMSQRSEKKLVFVLTFILIAMTVIHAQV